MFLFPCTLIYYPGQAIFDRVLKMKLYSVRAFSSFTCILLSIFIFSACQVNRKLLQSDSQPSRLKCCDLNWAREAVFYQVFVRSFYDGSGDGIGDFKGLKKKIPYFNNLGVNALWLMPVNSAESYHGYDVIDYFSIEPDFGNKDDFVAFLSKAQENDIKVIIDLVVNHTATSHPWFKNASEGPDNPYFDYYIWTTEPEKSPLPEEKFRPLQGTDRYYYAHYAYHMPDLNYQNPEVRRDIKEVALYWLELGVDGFRLDGANMIDPVNRDGTIDWWYEFNTFVKSVNPEAFLVGENWYHLPEDIGPYYQALESSFNFVTAELLYKMALGSPLNIVDKIHTMHELYSFYALDNPAHLSIDSTMISNHDMDRIATRLEEDKNKIVLAASLLFTLPGTPFIYYGDELGQTGQSPDPNRREPFPWYKNLKGPGMTTMEKRFPFQSRYLKPFDGISLEEQKGITGSIYEHYKRLIRIRHKYTALFYSENYSYYPVSSACYSYIVSSHNDNTSLLIIHNLSSQKQNLLIKKSPVKDLLDGKSYNISDILALEPHTSAVLKFKENPPFPVIEDFELPRYTNHFKVKVPHNTPDNACIFMAADINQWKPGDHDYRLEQENDYYTISLSFPENYLIQFKFTRGEWDKREQNISGEDLVGHDQRENRSHVFRADEKTVHFKVERWADICPDL